MNAKQPDIELTHRYSRLEAAELLGMSVRNFDRLKEAGQITTHYRKANKRPFFLGSEVLRVWRDSY
ncbi:hypothetical protein FACS189434_06680 [Bacteroidia bacterium]|nr:hypothetical protein FACS189434_06680 [Bacteroidia bacterium]